MSKNSSLEKYNKVLFDNDCTVGLSVAEADRVIRLRDIYVQALEKPALTKVGMRDYLFKNYPGISKSQAYRDINDVYILLGNVQNATRAHVQYVVNETLMEVIDKLSGKEKHYKELIMAVDKLAKYNQLDKEAAEPVDWSEMVDFSIEPTSDPTLLGIKPMDNLEEVKSKLYKRYAEDIEFESVPKDKEDDAS